MRARVFGRHLNRVLLLSLLSILTAAPIRASASPEETAASDSVEEAESNYGYYKDITPEQSELAHKALTQAYSANAKKSLKAIKTLRELESNRRLPPLSYLLDVAIEVMRYQNGDFEDADEEAAMLKSIEETAEQGSYLCEQGLKKEPNHPTYLLILGGIRGYLATLKIHGNPSQALSDGFQALKLLEKSRQQDPRIKDSYMGTGIFNCTAANAPLFVRATLKIIGRSVNMRTGLESLRLSAYSGQYTSVASQLFLIQFLSPYDEELKREKNQIFRTLESKFPRNAYYTFLKDDEALCFFPDSFYAPGKRQALANRICAFAAVDYSSRRYSNLVRYQYTLLDATPEKRFAPDTTFQLNDYNFYPAFVEALRFKRQTEDSLETEEKISSVAQSRMKAWRDSCIDLINDSPMNPTRKRYYQWHVADALQLKVKHGRLPHPAGESTTAR